MRRKNLWRNWWSTKKIRWINFKIIL